MKIPVKHSVHLELNHADQDALERDVGLGLERAQRIVAHRPFLGWDEVRQLEGMTDAIVDAMVEAGITLGDATGVDDVGAWDEEQRRLEQAASPKTDSSVGVPIDGARPHGTRDS